MSTPAAIEVPARVAMPPQAFIADEPPRREAVLSATNHHWKSEKPHDGIWTSTYTPKEDFCSAWNEWCHQNHWSSGDYGYVLKPIEEATVVEVTGLADLQTLVDSYERSVPWETHDRAVIDFDQLRRDGFDGVHLTASGQQECSSLFSEGPRLQWDCESTVWFRWCFKDDIERLGEVHR